MKLVIALACGLLIALILGRFVGVIGWVIGLAAAFALGTFLSGRQ